MKPTAQIHSVSFFGMPEHEYAHGICVSHPNEGHNGIYRGGPIDTTRVLQHFEDGGFETKNTVYSVVPKPSNTPIIPIPMEEIDVDFDQNDDLYLDPWWDEDEELPSLNKDDDEEGSFYDEEYYDYWDEEDWY